MGKIIGSADIWTSVPHPFDVASHFCLPLTGPCFLGQSLNPIAILRDARVSMTGITNGQWLTNHIEIWVNMIWYLCVCQKIGDQTPQKNIIVPPMISWPYQHYHHMGHLFDPTGKFRAEANWWFFHSKPYHGLGDEHPSLWIHPPDPSSPSSPWGTGTVFQIPNISGMSFTSFAFAKARTMPNFPSATAKSLGVRQRKGNGGGPKAYSFVIDMSWYIDMSLIIEAYVIDMS